MFPFLLFLACPQPAQVKEPVHTTAADVPPAPTEGDEQPTELAPGDRPAWTSYGEPIQGSDVISAEILIANAESYVDQIVLVEGRVADVCQKKGCWMVLTSGDGTLRVTMKDHGFSVAMDGTGSDCQVQGTVVKKAVDPETVAHFESESANPDVMPEKGTDAEFLYEIEATAVRMRPQVEAGG